MTIFFLKYVRFQMGGGWGGGGVGGSDAVGLEGEVQRLLPKP